MFCRNCGKELLDDWKACPNCGTKILAASTTQSNSNYDFERTQYQNPAGMPYRNFERIPYRSIWKYIFLSIITFGIYGIYLLYGYTKDVNKVCAGDGRASKNYIIVLLLSCITFGIYGVYWWYTQANRLYDAAPKYNIKIREQGSTILLWFILGITLMPGIGIFVATYVMFDNLNAIAKVYNGDISKSDVPRMKPLHPHLVRNVLIVCGILIVLQIASFVLFVTKFATNDLLSEDNTPHYKDLIEAPENSMDDNDPLSDFGDFSDLVTMLDRFLMESEEGIGDMYVTVYYGNDSHIVKEILYEIFISKEYYTADKVDPNNMSLADFSEFTAVFLGNPPINVQNIGNYYLLTADYTDMDDPETLEQYINSGAFIRETDDEGSYMDADYFMNGLKEDGCEQGYFAEKEYSSYFGSGREENMNLDSGQEENPGQNLSQEEYIFPNSDKQYLSEDEVRSMTIEDLFIGRNEIFARHGYIFKDEGLRNHFASTSWYEGTVPGEQFSNDVLNDFEKKNAELIKRIEDETR